MANSDILCGDCTGDAFLERPFTFSTPHLCKSMELIRKGPGSYDAEYPERDDAGAIMAGVIVGIITVLCEIVDAIFIIRRKRKKYQSPTQPDASIKLYCKSLLHSSLNTILKSVGPKPNEILPKLVIIAVILLLTVPGVSPACGQAEYLIGEDCCPMCRPGYFIWRHCTEATSTRCLPCFPSTFTDAPNGLVSCISCTVCNSGKGLRVKRPCSSNLDALCEPLDGYYCIDPIKDGCRGAKEHTKCNSGQYIKQQGTATSDSMCGDCVGDTYSDGSFTSCRPHTQCELMGLIVKRKGTTSNDTECAERGYTITIAVVGILAVCGVLVGIIIYRKRAQPDTLGARRGCHNSQVHNPVETTEVQLFTERLPTGTGVWTSIPG